MKILDGKILDGKILDGKVVAQKIHDDVQTALKEHTGRKPCLVAVLTTDNPASIFYVERKAKACLEVGMTSKVIRYDPKDTHDLLALIERLNNDDTVDGILVQLPLPLHVDPMLVIDAIDPEKDVDGFHPMNMGKLLQGDPSGFIPCTPLGIKTLLEYYDIEVKEKHVVIIGRSSIVGKPLGVLLMQNAPGCNATVTIAHRYTHDLGKLTSACDIVISAVGKPGLIQPSMLQKGAVVIDVGINKIPDSSKKSGYRIVGDVAFDEVLPKVSAITPVPGGVGPMTIAMLLQNTLKSYRMQQVK